MTCMYLYVYIYTYIHILQNMFPPTRTLLHASKVWAQVSCICRDIMDQRAFDYTWWYCQKALSTEDLKQWQCAAVRYNPQVQTRHQIFKCFFRYWNQLKKKTPQINTFDETFKKEALLLREDRRYILHAMVLQILKPTKKSPQTPQINTFDETRKNPAT